ncbi:MULTISPECIES: glyoxalase superfamily protein [unclassified Sulfitobacter]|uniref:glyoxalase superfamily protein n=1 Tax=unclassified Sulfitobacter TaxID=196795 RepID=UPI00374546BA
MNPQLPSAAKAKNKAKRLRAKMAEDGTSIGHAKSLELVADQHGFSDWNTMVAAIGNAPLKGWAIGDKVSGTYLSQPFTGHVVSISTLKPEWFRLELHLDEAVDVVTFDGFSNFRSRIRGVIGPKGHSIERTSDGQAHLQIDLW